eukprot:2063052-Rhodomonas_salina.1
MPKKNFIRATPGYPGIRAYPGTRVPGWSPVHEPAVSTASTARACCVQRNWAEVGLDVHGDSEEKEESQELQELKEHALSQYSVRVDTISRRRGRSQGAEPFSKLICVGCTVHS